MKQDNKIPTNENLKISGKQFDPSDYKGESELEQGLAITHEQAEDDYMEGTVDQLLK
jgi:hypothetical protein